MPKFPPTAVNATVPPTQAVAVAGVTERAVGFALTVTVNDALVAHPALGPAVASNALTV